MIGFQIDEPQAEFVAEIKLRHLNREYILKQTKDIQQLEKDIEDMEGILSSKSRVKSIITNELAEVSIKYGKPRRTEIVYTAEIEATEPVEEISDYPVDPVLYQRRLFQKNNAPVFENERRTQTERQ